MTFGKVVLALFATFVAVALAEADAEAESAPYAPMPEGDFVFFEGFEGEDAFEAERCFKSNDEKYSGQQVEVAADLNGVEGDMVVKLKNPAQHYGVVMPFAKAIGGIGADFVVQYEVRLTEGLECGGAYLKVLAEETLGSPADVNNDSPYIVMFGPDKCGSTNKVHFILRHQNPVSKEWEEKHLKSPPPIKTDSYSHLYTLVIQKDNNYKVMIDGDEVKAGSLFEDMEPPINPPAMIDDPEDSKPDDWVDEAQIADPEASKPDDWDEDAPMEIPDMDEDKPEGWLDDEPDYIDDPDAEKPDDWDDEEDGEFEPPQIENPKCAEGPGCGEWVRPMKANPDFKGKWSAPMIDNPEYKGEWAPAQIDNPNFFEDDMPSDLPMMSAVAVEIWTMSGGMTFDNVLVGSDVLVAEQLAAQTFEKKVDVQKKSATNKAKEQRQKARLELLEDGSLSGQAQYYFGEFMEVAGEYPVVVALTLIGFTFGTLFLVKGCCCPAEDRMARPVTRTAQAESKAELKAEAKAETKAETKVEEEEDDENFELDKEEEEEEDEPETKSKTLRRRKSRKKRAE